MDINNCVDYVRFSGYGIERTLSQLGIQNTGIRERPLYGYEVCYRLQTNPNEVAGLFLRGQAGELAQFSGKQLDSLRQEGITDEIMLRATQQHKMTRIDVAVDVVGMINTELHLERAYEKLTQKEADTLAREFARYQTTCEGRTGTTVSVGSRKSLLYLRIYNKAVESNFEESDWLRIELEAKGEKAIALQRMAIEQGTRRATRAQMSDFLKIRGIYTRALNKLENGSMVRFPRKKSDDLAFFNKVLIPYLRSRIGQFNHSHMAQLELIIEEWDKLNN